MPSLAPHSNGLESVVSLTEAAVGVDFQICSVEGPDGEQLRRLGFCESLQVRKIAGGRNLICSVCGARLAVSSALAEHIKVVAIA